MPKKRLDAALTVMQHNRQPIQNECRISISEKALIRMVLILQPKS